MRPADLQDLAETIRLDLLRQVDARRQEMGLEKKELAERCGLSRSLVQRAADGADTQLSNFIALALAVNVIPALQAAKESGAPCAPEDLVHRGLAHNRTRHNLQDEDRKREAALAKAWEQVNEHHAVGIQAHMPHLVPGCTQAQATAVATAMQWLGSEVGFDFLCRTLASVGYEIVRTGSR